MAEVSSVKEVSKSDFQIHLLRCLLSYRMRTTLHWNIAGCSGTAEIALTDQYAEALQEAIRCMEKVHGRDSLSHDSAV